MAFNAISLVSHTLAVNFHTIFSSYNYAITSLIVNILTASALSVELMKRARVREEGGRQGARERGMEGERVC